MQKTIRVNENQIIYLATKSRFENIMSGYLYKKSSDTGKWQLRWFTLYQNLLFYFENDLATRPSGVALMEGCYCDRILTPASVKTKENEKQYCFTITYKSENQRQYDLRTETESECNAWVDAIKMASYSKLQEQKEELEQKHLHLLQILDSERQAKWQYVQHTEELAAEVKKLKQEMSKYSKERKLSNHKIDEESEDIRKIKKVQSFFRGWLCRRRWKQIVDLYIRSPHAESMRKRNSIVFNMVESEEEYNRQLGTLVTCFLRPLRMAASSKKPPIAHEDVNSIFLNSETLLFLHQIFLKGLTARLENWPTLVLGDLFDMLLPMLCIYQEYVRNHHYSLQVLAEYKQQPELNSLLKRYEEKALCEGRSLEAFLTYPMHQVPRYIITLHDLLAHTPHDHVERQSLEYAQSKLEELSRIMHDEVSETENIRKNLSIERMIVEGCDILLDVNQTFVRQGTLLQVFVEKPKSTRGRLGSFSSTFKESKKELVRQVYLFTNHMLLTTRTANGKLHLAKQNGQVSLLDCTLIEDLSADIFIFEEDTSSLDSSHSVGSQASANTLLSIQTNDQRDNRTSNDYDGLDFRIIVDSKSGPPTSITLVASTHQEKAGWCSDISQCIENLHYSDLLNSSMSESSSVTMPQSVRSDPKLFRDDVDIKFSRTLNSCKVPQIRHASVDRLLDRLTDLRFLSIDFLNTFLLTYRVFTTGQTVLEALKKVYRNPEAGNLESGSSVQLITDQDILGDSPPSNLEFTGSPPDSKHLIKPQAEKLRRISTGCMNIEVSSGDASSENHTTNDTLAPRAKSPVQHRHSHTGVNLFKKTPTPIERGESTDSEESKNELQTYLGPPKPKLAPIASCETLNDSDTHDGNVPVITTDDCTVLEVPSEAPSGIVIYEDEVGESSTDPYHCASFANYFSTENNLLAPPNGSGYHGIGSSSDTLTGLYSSGDTSSTDTLTPFSTGISTIVSPSGSPKRRSLLLGSDTGSVNSSPRRSVPYLRTGGTSINLDALALSPTNSPIRVSPHKRASSPIRIPSPIRISTGRSSSAGRISPSRIISPIRSPQSSPKLKQRAPSPISYSYSSPNMIMPVIKCRPWSSKRGSQEAEAITMVTSRASFACQGESSPPHAKAGTVVTSSRASKRRESAMNWKNYQKVQARLQGSSSSAATTAFAKATAGSGIPTDHPKGINRHLSAGPVLTDSQAQNIKKRESVISTAATMRVMNVIKHWVSKHSQDFDCDSELKAGVKDMLEEMVCNTNLLPAEHKTAAGILRQVTKEDPDAAKKVDLETLLTPPLVSSKDTFDTLSALDIAEQLTYLDHQIFIRIRSEELLCQAWTKANKNNKAPHVLFVSKRFNEVSRLVVSEIISRQNMQERVSRIEKWAAIADICRCMHNYNGVLQICAAFVNSSVYRLKKTWEKISKQTKQMIERLQTLVSSDGRFKNMREALHRCDPPCIPYLGMYLTDLSFIEEGTPNLTDNGLVNFSKMRMVAHVIREIKLFQQTPYRIDHHPRITNYLLDPRRLMDEEQAFKSSLEIEPKLHPRLSVISTP